MSIQEAFVQLSPVVWEIPKSFRSDMRVPARIFATPKMLAEISRDRSLQQLVNVTTFPGIQTAALAMPDMHEGYGFPVGGVAATDYPDGVISPGGIGYDINCGVRLLTSSLTFTDILPQQTSLANKLYHAIPAGVGKGGAFRLKAKEFDELLEEGAAWVAKQGYGTREELDYIESGGTINQANPVAVSGRAKERGYDQLGTLGAGNHFVEIDRVEEIFAAPAAAALGLFVNQVVILIHTGSRGVGHQVATDYLHKMEKVMGQYGISVPDPELACAPFSSKEGTAYFQAMAAAANFAFANRQMLTWEIRQVWQEQFGTTAGVLALLYDVAHNIAKIEEHEIDKVNKKVIVHRKGATRAFPPNHQELPAAFRSLGQPVLTPGSMGTASYILLGTQAAMQQSFGSTCHGAGRRMSRHQAKREINGRELRQQLEQEGITIQSGSLSGIAEEAPEAYKDIHQVVEVVTQVGIAKKVARLRPLIVVKG